MKRRFPDALPLNNPGSPQGRILRFEQRLSISALWYLLILDPVYGWPQEPPDGDTPVVLGNEMVNELLNEIRQDNGLLPLFRELRQSPQQELVHNWCGKLGLQMFESETAREPIILSDKRPYTSFGTYVEDFLVDKDDFRDFLQQRGLHLPAFWFPIEVIQGNQPEQIAPESGQKPLIYPEPVKHQLEPSGGPTGLKHIPRGLDALIKDVGDEADSLWQMIKSGKRRHYSQDDDSLEAWQEEAFEQFNDSETQFTHLKRTHLDNRGLFTFTDKQRPRDFIGRLIEKVLSENGSGRYGSQSLYSRYKELSREA
ncbi:MAG: hypothetical protein AAGU11_02130 [Syntrophobacteraceae bacterium]